MPASIGAGIASAAIGAAGHGTSQSLASPAAAAAADADTAQGSAPQAAPVFGRGLAAVGGDLQPTTPATPVSQRKRGSAQKRSRAAAGDSSDSALAVSSDGNEAVQNGDMGTPSRARSSRAAATKAAGRCVVFCLLLDYICKLVKSCQNGAGAISLKSANIHGCCCFAGTLFLVPIAILELALALLSRQKLVF